MLEDLQFQLRRRWLGRIVVRRGLPRMQALPTGVDECAYYRKLLCAVLSKQARNGYTGVVDVGCRNWSYAPALAECFPNARLLGVEVDGYRRFWNGFRRIDYARAQAASLPQPARVVASDFLDVCATDHPGETGETLFCFIFPFVTDNPCLRWGLPTRHADYGALLRHAVSFVAPRRAHILAVHQGDWEFDEARKIYRTLGCEVQTAKLTPDAWAGLWPSPHDNWICFGKASAAEAPVH